MFDPSQISNIFQFLTAWSAAFIVTLWVSLVFWTYRDIRSRAVDPLARILAVLATAILFLPGVVIYLIIRPGQTLEEEYQKTLEEEALLHSIETAHHCPGCSRRVEDDWMICPDCQTRLKKTCHHCRQLMDLHWNICPHCGTTAPGMRKEGLSLDEALRPKPINSDDNGELDEILDDLPE